MATLEQYPVPVRPSRNPLAARFRVDRKVLVGFLALLALLCAAYVPSINIPASRGADITGDEPFYLLTTQSLLQDGDLDLRQQYSLRSYRTFFHHPDGLWRQSVSRNDGPLLSPHNPGLSVLIIPGFAQGGLVGAQVQLLLLAALTFALTYVLAARITGEAFWSWLATGAVALGATPFVYATEVYPELPAALMLVASLLLAHGNSKMGFWKAAALVALLTALVWLGVKYAPLAGIVALWAWWRMDGYGRIALMVGGSISAALFAWFHLETFGALTPYSVGVVYQGDSTLSVLERHLNFTDRVYRLLGLFIDQRFGIARWSPVLLLAGPGLVFMWRAAGAGRLMLALISTQLLVATFVAVTMMGWWFPGRTLVTVVPLLVPPLAQFLVRGPSWSRLGLGLLGVYTLGITAALAAAAYAGEITIAVNPFELNALLFRAAAPLFPDYSYWDTTTWLLTIGWLVVILGSATAPAWAPLSDRVFAIARALAGRTAVPRPATDILPWNRVGT